MMTDRTVIEAAALFASRSTQALREGIDTPHNGDEPPGSGGDQMDYHGRISKLEGANSVFIASAGLAIALLLAITGLLWNDLSRVEDSVSAIRTDVVEIRSGVSVVTNDISKIGNDVSALRNNMADLSNSVVQIDTKIDGLAERISSQISAIVPDGSRDSEPRLVPYQPQDPNRSDKPIIEW